jgi:hypothetical protein
LLFEQGAQYKIIKRKYALSARAANRHPTAAPPNHGYARGAERAIVSTMARGIARLGKPCAAPAAWRCSLRFFAPRRASGFWMVDLQDFSAELFLERAGLVRIGKTPSKIDLALSDNSPPVPHLNLSTRVKGCNPAAQIDI